MRANTYRAMGNLDQAIADHSESIRVGAGLGQVLQRPRRHLFPEGRLRPRARRHQQGDLVPAGQPARGGLYAIRAMLHQRMGEPAKGLADADRAIELNPRSAMALYVRARIYEALGRSEDAAAGMRAALAIDPRIKEQMEAMER